MEIKEIEKIVRTRYGLIKLSEIEYLLESNRVEELGDEEFKNNPNLWNETMRNRLAALPNFDGVVTIIVKEVYKGEVILELNFLDESVELEVSSDLNSWEEREQLLQMLKHHCDNEIKFIFYLNYGIEKLESIAKAILDL